MHPDITSNNLFGCLEEGHVVTDTAGKGNRKGCRRCAAPSAACTLNIIGRFWWNVAQERSLQFTNVNAHFEGCGTAQHIDLSFLELPLILGCSLRGKLSCMLPCLHGNNLFILQQLAIIDVFRALPAGICSSSPEHFISGQHP